VGHEHVSAGAWPSVTMPRASSRFRAQRLTAGAGDAGRRHRAHAHDPVGEYAMSVLGRERMFQHFSERYGTPVVLLRLNYAVELRYGVLADIGRKVYERRPVELGMGAPT